MMSPDDARKFISERLVSDAGFRERVANFIFRQGFVAISDNPENNGEDEFKDSKFCNKVEGFCSHLSKQNGRECPFIGELHGYEHWIG
ncbi:MAG: hypothetical protein FDX02_01935 [Chlorobium sp.]|nr:MAG: hypothetical protein FDX02_01935 [Chlorobium sp.]